MATTCPACDLGRPSMPTERRIDASIRNGLGVGQFTVLLKGSDRVGRVHQRGASAHVNGHAKRLLDLLTACAQLYQCFDMEADTTVAMGRNPKGKRYQFGISVVVPASGLTFAAGATGRQATADVSLAAMDDSGRMSETSKDQMKFTLPEGANESNAMLQYKTTLETRKGNHRIVVSVRDTATGKTGTATADIRVE